ncbi:GntR family transcriptional regulator [Sphingomonas koreensis]|nr:GntR family transcriptional regulator [Sphingomonas koreensis]
MATDTKSRLAPLRYESAPLRNQIIAAMRSAIETGILQPGARVIERDMCEQLNVSRTSLREALRELQALGVLSPTENRGLMVNTLTREDASNAYRIRGVLEALVAEQFIEHADEEEFDQLTIYGETLKKAYASGSVERMLRSKRAFYDCMCSGAQNALAFDLINRLTLRTSSLRSKSLARSDRQQQSVKEIDAILDAIARRDVAAAHAAAAAHVAHAAESALGTLESDAA